MTRSLLVVLVALAGCSPYKALRQGESNPMAGQTRFVLLPLVFTAAEVDGDPVSKWIAGQDADWKKEWPDDQANAAREFAKGAADRLAGTALGFTTAADPQGATLSIKPSVTELATGGRRPTILLVSAQLLDPNGASVEEISTKAEVKNMFTNFETRLNGAAAIAGGNVAGWVEQRATSK